MSDLDFSGARVLVVGGSSGIGNAIAQAFRVRGASVSVWGTQPSPEGYSAADGSDLDALAYAGVDVADVATVEAAAAAHPALDVLILSQGTVAYRRAEFERSAWDRVMGVNLDSLMTCARVFKPALAASQGKLIIVSSISGLRANIGNPAYAASKAAAISLTKTLGAAWARDGIRVNGLAPGLTETKLTRVTTDDPQRHGKVLKSIPAGRFAKPEDMAGAALFLASPLAAYVVGHTLVVDGGVTLS